MNTRQINLKVFIVYAMGLLMSISASTALAEPVWHCSRTDVQVANASDQFTLATLSDREVIQVSLRDLHHVYEGKNVKLTGQTLSACIARSDTQTSEAMHSLGISEHAVISMGHRYNITRNSVYVVNDMQAMEQCIAQHHPAIGYLPRAVETEALGPCF